MSTKTEEGKTLKFEGTVYYQQIRNLKNIANKIKKLDLSNCSIEVNMSKDTELILPAFEEVDLSNTVLKLNIKVRELTYLSISSNCKRLNITNFKMKSSDIDWIEIHNFFSSCKRLEEVIGFSSFLKLNREAFSEDTEGLFKGCRSLKSIDFGDDYTWDIKTSYLGWFDKCDSLEYMNLGNIGAAPEKTHVCGLFYRLSPNVKIKHKGKFNSKIIYSESGYYIIYNEQLANNTNPFKYLFENPKDSKKIIQAACELLTGYKLSEEEVKKIPIIHCKTPEELEVHKLKQELLGTDYLDLLGGLVYISDNDAILLLLEEDY